jgi:hypothetical protein
MGRQCLTTPLLSVSPIAVDRLHVRLLSCSEKSSFILQQLGRAYSGVRLSGLSGQGRTKESEMDVWRAAHHVAGTAMRYPVLLNILYYCSQ